MKDLRVGKIVKTKKGHTCVVVDILDDEAIIFNITKMCPDKIKIKDIKEIIGEADHTSMVIDGKKITIDNDDDEKEETDSSENQNSDDLDKEEENDSTQRFGEMIKAFGQAAISLGNILVDIAKEDEDGEC